MLDDTCGVAHLRGGLVKTGGEVVPLTVPCVAVGLGLVNELVEEVPAPLVGEGERKRALFEHTEIVAVVLPRLDADGGGYVTLLMEVAEVELFVQKARHGVGPEMGLNGGQRGPLTSRGTLCVPLVAARPGTVFVGAFCGAALVFSSRVMLASLL